MSLVGDLEFKTIIDNRPALLKMSNAHLNNIEVFSEGCHKKVVFTVETIKDEGKDAVFTIETIGNEEEEH